MTANRGLFVRNSGTTGTTPIEGRLVLASMLAENAPGVPRQGLLDQKVANLVTGSASNMSYNVGPCSPVLNRATGEGVYMFTLTGTTNVATDAAPATGSRWDLIYVKQNDPDKGDTGNTAVLGVQKGTAAASPVKPTASLPAGAYVLAEALVQSGAPNAADAKVTITQVWRYTALRGNAIPVRSTAERDEITATFGTRVARVEIPGWPTQVYDGAAWRGEGILKPFAHMGKTNNFQALGSSQTKVVMTSAQIMRGGFTFDGANSALVVPVTGRYRVSAKYFFTGGSATLNQGGVWINGANPPGEQQGPSANTNKADGNDVFVHGSGVMTLNAGDKVSMWQLSAVSCWGNSGWDGSFIEIEYISPVVADIL